MLNELTSEQIKQLKLYRDKWANIGLSTARANRPEAEKGIQLAYKIANLPPPKQIVWCDSPLSMYLVRHVLEFVSSYLQVNLYTLAGNCIGHTFHPTALKAISREVQNLVMIAFRQGVGLPVASSVASVTRAGVAEFVRDVQAIISDSKPNYGALVLDHIRANLGAKFLASVRDSVLTFVQAVVGKSSVEAVGISILKSIRHSSIPTLWDSVIDTSGVSVWDTIVDSLMATVGSFGHNSIIHTVYGQHDAHWLGVNDYFHHVCNLRDETDKLHGFWQIAKNAACVLAYKDICLVCERHNILNYDDQYRLHCEDGYAVGYPDGWGVYAWYGVRVPEYLNTQPDEITPEKIMTQQNSEVARVMIELYGQDNFIRDGGFSKIQSDDYGDLYRIEFDNGDESIVAVHVQDPSTDRDYFLYVPRHIRSAHQGVAWTFGYNRAEDYHPLIET